MISDYANGYIERTNDGSYAGVLKIHGIDISPIIGVYFTDKGDKYLWLKRKKILEYDEAKMTFVERERIPQFEAYLKKTPKDDAVEWRGTFNFMRWSFSIVGMWDYVTGLTNGRINLYVERLPIKEQTIINNIVSRKYGA